MNSDIALMDRDRLQDEVSRLRAVIRALCDSEDFERSCSTSRLSSIVPEGPAEPPKLPSWNQLLSGRVSNEALN